MNVTTFPPRGRGVPTLSDLHSLTVLDVKSSALDVEQGRIESAVLADVGRDGRVHAVRRWRVEPGEPIGAAESNVVRLGGERPDERLDDGGDAIVQIVEALRERFDAGLPVVAFHAARPFTVIDREARRHAVHPATPAPVIDPFAIDKAVDPFRSGSRRLVETASSHGIPVDRANAHGPLFGVVVAGLLAWTLLDRFAGEIGHGTGSLLDIHRTTAEWELGARSDARAAASWPVLPTREEASR
ncbi:hypothetical protein F8O01_10775 [Pseudoclavibacter chungangensis]|uniref:3'-5' exonuclease n=1 Tax=Pseudoclavibacter chungangensis TaxID=587635 RepID=A0A7J5BT24_9MICO|nr:hypothetical protein [Pseudoclavibacter chungangensis]KAB1656342.1 hypothetical protein F8O01_10775 [Pseudoclavibacter chungangensis]NYJ67111.1 DNA polymerase-3 subunit epsilon [Pseudoclavibacter chungangensis]